MLVYSLEQEYIILKRRFEDSKCHFRLWNYVIKEMGKLFKSNAFILQFYMRFIKIENIEKESKN